MGRTQKCLASLHKCVDRMKEMLKERYYLLYVPDLHDGGTDIAPVFFSGEFWAAPCGKDGKTFLRDYMKLTRNDEKKQIRVQMRLLVAPECGIEETSGDPNKTPYLYLNMNFLLRKWPLSMPQLQENEKIRTKSFAYLLARLFGEQNWREEARYYQKVAWAHGKELVILENAYKRMKGVKESWKDKAVALKIENKRLKKEKKELRNATRRAERAYTGKVLWVDGEKTVIQKQVSLIDIDGTKRQVSTGVVMNRSESDAFKEGVYVKDARYIIVPDKSFKEPMSPTAQLALFANSTQPILVNEPTPQTELDHAKLRQWIAEARNDILISEENNFTFTIVALVEDYGEAKHPLLMKGYKEDKEGETLYMSYCATITLTFVTKANKSIYISCGEKKIDIVNANVDWEYSFFGKRNHVKLNEVIGKWLKNKFKITSKSIFRTNGNDFLCGLSESVGMNRQFGSLAYNYGLSKRKAATMFNIMKIWDSDASCAFIAPMKITHFPSTQSRDFKKIDQLQEVWQKQTEKYTIRARLEDQRELEILKKEIDGKKSGSSKKRKRKDEGLFSAVTNESTDRRKRKRMCTRSQCKKINN